MSPTPSPAVYALPECRVYSEQTHPTTQPDFSTIRLFGFLISESRHLTRIYIYHSLVLAVPGAQAGNSNPLVPRRSAQLDPLLHPRNTVHLGSRVISSLHMGNKNRPGLLWSGSFGTMDVSLPKWSVDIGLGVYKCLADV